MNTVTQINWARTELKGGTRQHTGHRSGWHFTITTPKGGTSVLTGAHVDGRTVDGAFVHPSAAKAAAMAAMRPSEAMAWATDHVTKTQSACWDGHVFTFGSYQGRLYFQHREDGQLMRTVPVSSSAEARQLAAGILDAAYGTVAPSGDPVRPRLADALEAALTGAGITFGKAQLRRAALALGATLSV